LIRYTPDLIVVIISRMYYYIIIILILLAIGFYYNKNKIEKFQDLSGIITDLSGNPFKDPDGNILVLTQEHVDYVKSASQIPLTPVQQQIVENHQQNPDTRPLDDSGKQCDMLQLQYTSMVDKSQHYRDAGDWNNYKIILKTLANIQSKLSELGCIKNQT